MYKRGFLASFASFRRENARKGPVFQGFRHDARKSAFVILASSCVMVAGGASLGRREKKSLLAQDQVQHPAAQNMRPRSSAVSEDVRIVAPGFFKGVSQRWQVVESPVGVDALG